MARSFGSVAAARAGRSSDAVLEQLGRRLQPVRQSVGRHLDDEDRSQPREVAAHLQHALREPEILDDGDLGIGVAGEVLDLLGRRRVVDADRRGPQELRRDVEPVEIGPVPHHQQQPFPGDQPGVLQSRRRRGDVVGELLQRPGVPLARLPSSHRVERGERRMGGDEIEEALRRRLTLDGLVDLLDSGGGHRVSFPCDR